MGCGRKHHACAPIPPRLSQRCQFLQNSGRIMFVLLLLTSQFLGVTYLCQSLIFYLQRKEKISTLNWRDGENSYNLNIIKVQISRAIKKSFYFHISLFLEGSAQDPEWFGETHFYRWEDLSQILCNGSSYAAGMQLKQDKGCFPGEGAECLHTIILMSLLSS